MNKVDGPSRPGASLKFTIDNILNLKTSGRNYDSCHSPRLQDDTGTGMRKDSFHNHYEERGVQRTQDPDTRLHGRGKGFRGWPIAYE